MLTSNIKTIIMHMVQFE